MPQDPDDSGRPLVPAPPPSLIPPADTTPPPRLPAAPPSRTSSSTSIPAPRSSRSMIPLPAVEPILDQAAAMRVKHDFDGALDAYKKALFLAEGGEPATHASIYASIAEVKLAQGKPREAETNFEKALGAKAKHLRSIDGLVMIATQAKEWDRAATYRRKRADALDDPDEKANELCRLADMLEGEAKDPRRAAEALELAGLFRPGDIGILIKLKNLYQDLRLWQKLLDVLDELVRVSTDHRHRGTYRFQQADVVLGRLREEPRGIAFLEMALDEDPQCDRALSALVAVRTRREEWAELAAAYERLVDRYAGLEDRERAWEACRRLATVRRDRMLDGPGAVDAFVGAVALRPDDVESRASLAELYAAKGDRTGAVRELEIAARHAPLRAQTYRRLFDFHARAQRPDRAWLVATCLEELGASDVAHDLVIEQYRPDGAIRPTTALDRLWWDDCLGAPGCDGIVKDILRAIGDTAVALRLEEKKPPPLDSSLKQDKASTASVVRTFVWAARALDVPLPDLYMLDDVPSGIAAIPAPSPSTALGPLVRSGMTVQQLAFLAGRHLTYYLPEHYPLIFFPTLADLSSLVLSAVSLVIPSISAPPPPDGEPRVSDLLGARLTAEQKDALKDAVDRLDARGGKMDLLAFIRSVELTAQRAGLLLAGDLRTVMRIVKEETRPVAELTTEAKRGDLLAFCASEEYGVLRERMGVAILPPPTPAD